MSQYEIIQNLIRLMPILLILCIFVLLIRHRWYWRLSIIAVSGWLIVASSTMLYWWYAIEYAPSQEIQFELAKKDGAPRLFGTLFGWAFALVYLAVLELIHGLYLLGSRLFGFRAKNV